MPEYSPTTALSTFLSSITLPSKDQPYSALSDDKGSVIGHPPLPAKDWPSSAPLGNTASSTTVPASEPDVDKTVVFTPLANSSPSQSETTAPTTSSSPSNPDKDKTNTTPCLPTVTSVSSNIDGLVPVNVLFNTAKNEEQVSLSLVVTANYEKPSHVATFRSERLMIPEKDRTASKEIPGNYATTSSPGLSESLQFAIPSKDEKPLASSAKDDKTIYPYSFSSTVTGQYKYSSELLKTTENTAAFPSKSPSSHENDKSASTSVTANEKTYPSFWAHTSSISFVPEKEQTITQQELSPVSVPSRKTSSIPAKDQAYTALEVTSLTSSPKQQQTVNSLPFEYQQSALSLSLISSLPEISSSYIPDKDKTSASSQGTSPSIPDKDVTSASPQGTSIKSITDKGKTPSNSSVIAHNLSSEIYLNSSSSLDTFQTSSSDVFSKNEVTIPLGPSKDQASSIVLTKPQKSNSGTSFNYKQTGHFVSVEIPSSGLSQLHDGKTINFPIPGSLVYTSAVISSSGPIDSRASLTATDSLPVKDQTSPTPSISTPVINKVKSVSVISSPLTVNQEARESIIRNILLSYGISTSPEEEQPVASFISDETSLVRGTTTSLSEAVTTPAFVKISTGTASVSVTYTNSVTTLITPKPETLKQTRVPQLGNSLVSTSGASFLNSSKVIPVWTPAMLGNAYGGGYIITPSLFVTRFPNSPEYSRGIPPGYEQSSKSEDIRPPYLVPTPVAVKVKGSTTAFPSANTSPSVITASKDETNKPSDSVTSSDALNVGDRVTLYPGAGTPTGLSTGSRGATSKPSDTVIPVTNKVEGSRTAPPSVTTPTTLSTESRNGPNQPGDSSNHPNYSLLADKSKDQTSGRVPTQADIPKESRVLQEEETVTGGSSVSISISRVYQSTSPSAESKIDLDQSIGVIGISSSPFGDLPEKSLVPSQPSVRGNDKADRASNLALANIPTFSKVTLSTTTVSKDKTDELTAFSFLPSVNGSIALSLSPLEPGYNDSTVSASRPTSVLEFEGLASKYTTGLSCGLIGISTFILLF